MPWAVSRNTQVITHSHNIRIVAAAKHLMKSCSMLNAYQNVQCLKWHIFCLIDKTLLNCMTISNNLYILLHILDVNDEAVSCTYYSQNKFLICCTFDQFEQ